MSRLRASSLALTVATTIGIIGLTGRHAGALALGATPTVAPRATPVPEPPRTATPGPSPTAGPSPIPTTTPSAPTALQILARMSTSVHKQGSVHADTRVSSWLDHSHFVTEHSRTDLEWAKALAELEHDTWYRTTTSGSGRVTRVERRTLYVAQNVAASREAPNPWYCEQLKNVQLESLFLPLQIQVTKASIVGTLTSNGIPAWHIVATSALAPSWTNKSVRIDFTITQPDNLLRQLRIRAKTRPAGTGAPFQLLESYSHYRQTLHIRLPFPCSNLAHSTGAK